MKAKKVMIIGILFITIWGNRCARVPLKMDLSLDSSGKKWVRQTLDKMTVEEKIGQMICCRVQGIYAHRESEFIKNLEKLVRQEKVGGFILFRGEIYETAWLLNKLQQWTDVPLLIASDLERGLGNQLNGATLFPPLMSLGAIGSAEAAYAMGKVTAVEARSVGIHITYAPVVDVNINPLNPIINTRSFGEEPELVGRLAQEFIKGCQEHGLIATAKHFPGHGDTDEDSHSVLPVVTGDRERLEKVEFYPFRKVIQAGVQAIMTAHLHLPALDPTVNMPATLSKPILTDLLRMEMSFKGLIVTDAMNMGGIITQYPPEEAALLAVQAGADIILIPPEPEKVIKKLIEAVKQGIIPESRLNESVHRILEAKAKLGLHQKSLVEVEEISKVVASPKHLEQSQLAFQKSITCVKNSNNILPLSKNKKKIAVFALSSDPGDYFAGSRFLQEIAKRQDILLGFMADAFTGVKFFLEALEKAREAEVYVVALFSRLRTGKGSVDLDEKYIQLIRNFSSSGVPVVVISFGSPYFIRHFPEIDAYLCAYRHASPAQAAAVEALFGEIEITGRLPVSIPGLFPAGFGIVVNKKNGL
ncbi:MAG: glycoside hydrolase family 3 protein [Acidobacteriota bacterium]